MHCWSRCLASATIAMCLSCVFQAQQATAPVAAAPQSNGPTSTVDSDTSASNITSFGADFPAFLKKFRDAETDAKLNVRCAECHRRFQMVCREYGFPFSGARDAEAWIATLPRDNPEWLEARQDLGFMLLELLPLADATVSKKEKRRKAGEAEEIYSELLAADSKNINLRFDHGRTLAFLGRNAEAAGEFRVYLDSSPIDEQKTRLAKRFIKQPELAAHRLMPSLQFKLSTGVFYNSAASFGSVAILDFWSSRCFDCGLDTSQLEAMLSYFPDSPITLVGISLDTDREKWLKALKKRDPSWSEAIDEDGRLRSLLSEYWIPKYIVVDGDGVVVYEGNKVNAMRGPLSAAIAAVRDELQ